MSFKKRLTYATIAFYFLCDGIEYAIVFPTVWVYLQSLGARTENLLGLSVAGYSVGAILIGPVVGRIFDKTKNAKGILIFMNVFEALGSLMYFAAMSPWFLVLSRFICGIGNSGGSAMIADITTSTEIKTRTAIISNLQAFRQIGLLTGPVFNLAFRHLDCKIGNFTLNKMTAPGLFMAFLGVILEVMYIFMYFNLVDIANVDKLSESLQTNYEIEDSDCETNDHQRTRTVSLNNDAGLEENLEDVISPKVVVINPVLPRSDHLYDCPNALLESAEAYMNSGSGEQFEDDVEYVVSKSADFDYYSKSHNAESVFNNSVKISNGVLTVYKDEFLRDEVVAILGLAFVSFFAQTSMETIVTPLSQRFFGFGDFENSMLFLFAGIEILFAFLSINLLSRRIEDRVLILIGGVLMIASLIWFLSLVPRFPHHSWKYLPYFGVGIFINLYGISLLLVCSISLYSKVISADHQGFGHGLRRTMLSAGTILGPLWGGAAVNYLVLLFSIPLAAVFLFLLLFVLSYSRMKVDIHLVKPIIPTLNENEPNERTSLLRH